MARVPATQLSLEYLRKQGMIADVVEQRIPIYGQKFMKKRDLFNLFDIVAISTDFGGWGHNYTNRHLKLVQVTSASNRSSRRKKILAAEDTLFHLRMIPGHAIRIELHSWKKRGMEYEVKVEEIKAMHYCGGETRIEFEEVSCQSMKVVRATWRKQNPTSDRRERKKVR